MVLVEFLTTELEIDDALELTDVERFGKGFKNRPTCTLIVANLIYRTLSINKGPSCEVKNLSN